MQLGYTISDTANGYYVQLKALCEKLCDNYLPIPAYCTVSPPRTVPAATLV